VPRPHATSPKPAALAHAARAQGDADAQVRPHLR
jgi:hypothetical protein